LGDVGEEFLFFLVCCAGLDIGHKSCRVGWRLRASRVVNSGDGIHT
jgi:hypothetical protein